MVYINEWYPTEDNDVPNCHRYELAGQDLWLAIEDKETGYNRRVVSGHYSCGFMHGFYYDAGGKIEPEKIEVTHYWVRDSAKPPLPEDMGGMF